MRPEPSPKRLHRGDVLVSVGLSFWFVFWLVLDWNPLIATIRWEATRSHGAETFLVTFVLVCLLYAATILGTAFGKAWGFGLLILCSAVGLIGMALARIARPIPVTTLTILNLVATLGPGAYAWTRLGAVLASRRKALR